MNPLLEFKIISKHRMVNHYYPKLCTALNYLKEDQLWSREAGEANSIGGIMVHIVEHTGYHLGQIIDRTQRMTGRSFQFVQQGINEKALQQLIKQDTYDEDR